jgi:hypothetical protein
VTARAPALAVGCVAATLLTFFPADVLAQNRAVARPAAPRTQVVVRSYAPRYYYPYGYYPYRPYGYYGGFYGGFYGYYGFGGWPYYYQVYPPPFYGGYWDSSGSLRLQVMPRETEVFIDGYFAGTVDDFDGTFQRLHVQPGDHELELFHPQHRSVQQKVYLQAGKTFTVKLDMAPLTPGDPAPVRPTASQTSSTQSSSSQTPDPQERRARDPQRPGVGQRPGPRTASEFGAVSLRVQPRDAEVLIDGERWDGSSGDDRLVVELAPGTHHVEVRKDGFRTYRTDLTVRRGETTTLNVGLAAN